MGAAAGYFVGIVNQRTTTSVSIVTTTKYVYLPNGQPFMDEPAVYSSLGYPKITYNGYSRYISPEPNYTFTYHTPNVYLRVGNVTVPVISLTRAVGLAAQAAKLNPTNFSLAEADFVPGDIMNGSLSSRPSWGLFFAESSDGYWIYGSCGNGAYSVFVSVDALDGAVSKSANDYCSGSNLPITSTFELRVNSAYALRVVRAANLSGVPTALEKNGTVDFIEPRIVSFGPSSNNLAFQNPLNSSYSGATRLCWVVQMYSPVPRYGYQGTFTVDAETGELVSGWAQALFPNSHYEYVTGSPIFASARNLNVSAETFKIDGNAVGVSGSVPVVIPNVVIARPGSTGTVELGFSSTVGSDVNATFSFSDPLPGYQALLPSGLPMGVSIQTSSRTLIIPSNGQMSTNLLISVDQSAPMGTYFIELKATLYDSHWAQPGESRVFFFLSIWNGSGQWPAPPNPQPYPHA